MSLYERACRNALVDIYWDLAICEKLMKKHPDWEWLADKKAELEVREVMFEAKMNNFIDVDDN